MTLLLAVPVLAHGDAVDISDLASAWKLEPVPLAAAALLALLFGQGFLRLRARGRRDRAGSWRVVLFLLGLGLATLALVSPLDAIGEEYLLSGHMLQHVLLADAAPALMVVAISGPLAFFLLPPPLLRRLARLAWLRALLCVLLRPAVSFALWALIVASWHVPAAYEYALSNRVAHDIEHASFVLVGLLVWIQLVDPVRRGELWRSGRIALAIALFASGQVLADVLIFSFDPVYGAYSAQDERLFGLSPMTDQRLAGLVMMVEQVATLGTCLALLVLAYRREVVSAERGARQQVRRGVKALDLRS
jgi:putative membrane protein